MKDKTVVLEIANMGSRYGIETFNMNVLRNIDHTLVEIDFLSLPNGPFDDEIKLYGGKIYKIAPLNHIFARYNELKKLLRNHPEISTVHIHGNSAIGCLDAIAVKKAGISQIIVHSHNDSCFGIKQKILHIVARCLIYNKSTLKLSCSKAAGEWMFGKHAEFEVIPNAIDLKKFSFSSNKANIIRKKYGIENCKVIGHVGRMEPQKNHKMIISVFEEVYKNHSDVRLLLVGNGSLKKEVIRLISNKGLTNIVTIVEESENVEELLCAMDVFLFPSIWEGLGISLVEAQASGLPCIVSDAIKEEVCVTNLIKKVPLCKSFKYWSGIVSEKLYLNKERKSDVYIKQLAEAGFDIALMAKHVQDIYCGF